MGALIVLDTNIVLDLLVFEDAHAKPLHAALTAGSVQWLATVPMRDELERVLAYSQIARRLGARAISPQQVLQAFDTFARIAEPAARAPYACKDPDDQKFIDLAVAHRCPLLSKDRAVTSMAKRLARLDVVAAPRYALPFG